MRLGYAAALAFLAPALMACGGEGGAGAVRAGGSGASGPVVERDTVGDTLVVRTVSGRVWDADARLVPELAIGDMEGDEAYLFGRISSFDVGPDGHLYVLDGQAAEVRVFAPDGTYVRTLGGPGEGPGELKSPSQLTVLSDGRVAVRDPGNTRLQVYAPDGSETWEWPVVRGGFMSSNPLWRDRADHVYVFLILNPGTPPPEWKGGLLRVAPDGTPVDTLAYPQTGFQEPTLEARREGAATMTRVPFAPAERLALHPDGYFIYGTAEDASFLLLKPGGPVRVVWPAPRVPVPAAERDRSRRQIERMMRMTDPDWTWNGPDIPDVKAPYTGFAPARDGRIWVRVAAPAEERENPDFDPSDPGSPRTIRVEPVVYDVFGDDGTYFGRVRAPEGFRTNPLPVIDADVVWAATTDDLGVPRLVRFRVERTPPAP